MEISPQSVTHSPVPAAGKIARNRMGAGSVQYAAQAVPTVSDELAATVYLVLTPGLALPKSRHCSTSAICRDTPCQWFAVECRLGAALRSCVSGRVLQLVPRVGLSATEPAARPLRQTVKGLVLCTFRLFVSESSFLKLCARWLQPTDPSLFGKCVDDVSDRA